MKTLVFVGCLCLLVSVGFVLSGCGKGDEAKAGPQTTCPMMKGNPINKKIYVDHKGKRVYFCCSDCVKGFNLDPDKYMKEMTDNGVILEDAP